MKICAIYFHFMKLLKSPQSRIILLVQLLIFPLFANIYAENVNRWSVEKAQNWQKATGLLVGSNFVPSTASNPLEMWQQATWDEQTIDRELHWAESLGFNCMRVFLSDLLWESDAETFYSHIDRFLEIAESHHIGIMFVFFDSVWNPVSSLGPQPEPIPHLHNSQWIQSPSAARLKDHSQWSILKSYVQSILRRYGNDPRVVVWDLYNEPDNHNFGKFPESELADKWDHSFELLKSVFSWAREVNPTQPLTSGVWWQEWDENSLHNFRFNEFQLSHSDIITFHSYDTPDILEHKVRSLQRFGRPLVCTEYMARPRGSTFENALTFMAKERIGAINWGFVNGRSQTIYPWDSWEIQYTAEPPIWFHDIFHADGTPYIQTEVDLIRKTTRSVTKTPTSNQ